MRFKTKLTIYFLLFVLFFSMLIVFYTRIYNNFIKEQINKNSIIVINEVVYALEEQFDLLKTKVNNFTNVGYVKEYVESQNREYSEEKALNFSQKIYRGFIDVLVKSEGSSPFRNIIVIGENGETIASANENYRDYVNSLWWQKLKKNKTYISEVIFFEKYDEKIIFVVKPIYNSEKKMIGAVRGDISLEVMLNGNKRFKRFAEMAYFVILDKNSDLIWNNIGIEDQENFQNTTVYKEYEKGRNSFIYEDAIYSFSEPSFEKSKEELNWRVIIKQPTKKVFANAHELNRILLFGLLLVTIGSFFVSRLIALSISKPLERISNAALKLGEGNLDVEIEILGDDEIGDLSLAMRIMLKKLKKLYTEVQFKNRELENYAKYLKKINEKKTMAVSDLGHELRTPLNGIIGISASLLKYDSESLNKNQKEGIKLVQNNGESLLRIINDILDISKLESGKIEIRQNIVFTKNLIEYSRNIFETVVINKKNRGVDLKFIAELTDGVPEKFISDEIKLNRIFTNIVENATKFTESGEIRLKIYSDYKKIYFEISDTGDGISKEELRYIFERYTQGKSSDTRAGIGLGLNLSKKLIEFLGGEISVESIEKMGTTVTFYLPNNSKP